MDLYIFNDTYSEVSSNEEVTFSSDETIDTTLVKICPNTAQTWKTKNSATPGKIHEKVRDQLRAGINCRAKEFHGELSLLDDFKDEGENGKIRNNGERNGTENKTRRELDATITRRDKN
ncbi:conserved Plasmodium protein, unknown function [Plasmodium ovale wallikeri]|uniref:Uncharacterized protein n=1 Tax=Plasmodium ovale wallikeri TaxID=864142 RepID=A0A1A8YX68_PLAOA|nr:conserved Plasmodium protein, unknown function [Plasmodium ovale wallikeri]SBT36529.1 conserved Plasmodium protein, unknown function [Plasmodium ovale wallikeri]